MFQKIVFKSTKDKRQLTRVEYKILRIIIKKTESCLNTLYILAVL